MDAARVYPEAAAQGSRVLTPAQVKRWQEEGYAVVNGLLPQDLVDRVHRDSNALFTSNPQLVGPDFGAIGFPFLTTTYGSLASLNEVPLHPRLLQAVHELLGDEPILLSQAELWGKRGIAEPVDGFKPLVNQDQRMHIDVWNHTLTVPSPWDVPEAVTAILYLSDVADCEGGTAVVPRTPGGDESYPYPNFAMPGVGGIPWINDRKCAEAFLEQHYPEVHAFRRQLYTRERTVAYRVGTVLLYRYDTWHRGRPITPGALRVVMNLAWKRRSCGLRITSWQAGWAKSMYEWPVPGQLLNCAGQFETLVCGLTDEQRGALGFPLLDDAYWRDLRNVRLTRLRYGPAFQSQLPTLEQLDAMEEGASPSRTPADVATDTALRRRLLAVAVCLGVVAVARRWL